MKLILRLPIANVSIFLTPFRTLEQTFTPTVSAITCSVAFARGSPTALEVDHPEPVLRPRTIARLQHEDTPREHSDPFEYDKYPFISAAPPRGRVFPYMPKLQEQYSAVDRKQPKHSTGEPV